MSYLRVFVANQVLSRIRAFLGLFCPDFYSDIRNFTQILCRYLAKKSAAKTSGNVPILAFSQKLATKFILLVRWNTTWICLALLAPSWHLVESYLLLRSINLHYLAVKSYQDHPAMTFTSGSSSLLLCLLSLLPHGARWSSFLFSAHPSFLSPPTCHRYQS